MKTKIRYILSGFGLAMVSLSAMQAEAATLNVCQSGCSYSLPSQAYSAAVAGDTIAIQPGTYNDCIYIQKSNLTIMGVNGMPKMVNKVCGQKGILVTAAQNLTIKNMELSGATNNENYAGIRHDAAGFNLTLDNVYSHDNDNGILASSTGDTITITNSRFENNGMNSASGMAHNLYIAKAANMIFKNSKSSHAKLGGHEFKSRAARTEITSSTLATIGGNDSRLIDLSNGGTLIVQNSVLEKGSTSSNNDMIAFAPEGLGTGRTHSVTITGNTIIGDRSPTDLIYYYNGTPSMNISANTLVSIRNVTNSGTAGSNTVYASRTAAGLQAYPYLPAPSGSTPTPPPPTTTTPTPPPPTTTTSTTTTSTTTTTMAPSVPSTPGWTRCASENATCSFSGTRNVRYGANGTYITTVATTSMACNNTAFGKDPVPGVAKACEYSTTTLAAPKTGTFKIRTHMNTNYCNDVASATNGSPAHLWSCGAGNTNQSMSFTSASEIRVHGKCLHVTSTASGSTVVAQTCNGSANQRWTYNSTTRQLKGLNNMCLDLAASKVANGTKINAYNCSGTAANQQWDLTGL